MDVAARCHSILKVIYYFTIDCHSFLNYNLKMNRAMVGSGNLILDEIEQYKK